MVTKLAVMGFLRVLPLVRQFYGLVSQAERHFDESPPDAVVLVDFAWVIKFKPGPDHPHLLRWRTNLAQRPSLSA